MKPTDTGGPALGQSVRVWRGAPKAVGMRFPDPTGAFSVPGVKADWWAGVLQYPASSSFSGGPVTIAGTADAAHKADLAVTTPVPGYVDVTFVIEPEDIAGVLPSQAAKAQHEIWLTPPGGDPVPVAIGTLDIYGTVKGAAA